MLRYVAKKVDNLLFVSESFTILSFVQWVVGWVTVVVILYGICIQLQEWYIIGEVTVDGQNNIRR
jgi:hypothetical protein